MDRRSDASAINAVEQALKVRDITDLHDDVKAILVQTKLTNGRVNKLEQWQSFVMGGLAVLVILFVPILFIVVKSALEK